MQLKGKCVLITGAGSGIGRALAVEAARRGMTAALCGRRADALAQTAALLGAGTAHIVIQADVTRPDARRMLVDRIRERWGKLDVLINNAGIAGPTGRVDTLSALEVDRTIDVNLKSQFYFLERCTPLLAASKR
ncbi:MAG: SDR family NAD(P)-dependent oxidoreductase, partial [Methylocystis sp.]